MATQNVNNEWPFAMVACEGASADPWLLVALGTSETSGSGAGPGGSDSPAEAYPGQYARILCEELGVTVELHSYFPTGNDLAPLSWWNGRVAEDAALRSDLADARIVAMWALASHDVVPTFFFGACRGDWPDPLKGCIEQTVAAIPEQTDAVFGAIREIVDDDAVVLAADGFTPPAVLDLWGNEPFWQELHAMLDPASTVAVAAKAHAFTLVPTELALNGPTGMAPVDPSLIQEDGLHLTREGQAVVARALARADGLGD